jgi:hypothetical protein
VSDRHGWIGTETVHTRLGDFEFRNGYPTQEAADALLDQLKFNRAIEVFLTQIPPVAVREMCNGMRGAGARPYRLHGNWVQTSQARVGSR